MKKTRTEQKKTFRCFNMIPNSKPAEHNKCKVKSTAFPHLQSLVSYSIEPNRDLYKDTNQTNFLLLTANYTSFETSVYIFA